MDRPQTASGGVLVSSGGTNHLVRSLPARGKSCRRCVQSTTRSICRVCDQSPFNYDALTNPDASKTFIIKLSIYARNKAMSLDYSGERNLMRRMCANSPRIWKTGIGSSWYESSVQLLRDLTVDLGGIERFHRIPSSSHRAEYQDDPTEYRGY